MTCPFFVIRSFVETAVYSLYDHATWICFCNIAREPLNELQLSVKTHIPLKCVREIIFQLSADKLIHKVENCDETAIIWNVNLHHTMCKLKLFLKEVESMRPQTKDDNNTYVCSQCECFYAEIDIVDQMITGQYPRCTKCDMELTSSSTVDESKIDFTGFNDLLEMSKQSNLYSQYRNSESNE